MKNRHLYVDSSLPMADVIAALRQHGFAVVEMPQAEVHVVRRAPEPIALRSAVEALIHE